MTSEVKYVCGSKVRSSPCQLQCCTEICAWSPFVLIYINDLPAVCSLLQICLFADDTTVIHLNTSHGVEEEFLLNFRALNH